MKLFLFMPRNPNMEDVDTFEIPSKPVGVKYGPGVKIMLFAHGPDFWTIPLYHN